MAAPVLATYRLQLTPDFTFADAEALVPYFRKLGVSHLYLSPIAEAVPGSTHGYDVVDPTAVRSEIGGREGFESLRQAAVQAGLGLILDFVPNHAGVHPSNERWQHTLAHGPHADPQYFDIDWEAGNGKVLLPFLGSAYGTALDDGEITLVFERGRLFAAYYDHRFALRPDRYADVLDEVLPEPDARPSGGEEGTRQEDVLDAYRALSPGDADRARQLRPRFEALAEETNVRAHLENLQGPALHDLLEQQHWRLAHWRTSMADLNYRRFFQINDLAALRQEADPVFRNTHRLLAELAAEDGVDGVRIDHIDGLADPERYLEKLHRELGIENVWVEKILADGETLPAAWPVEGTSGYAFMNDAIQVLTDPDGQAPLSQTYRTFTGTDVSFADESYAGKSDVMTTTLAADRRSLARALKALADRDYHTRDLSLPALDDALTEVTAAFGRYRTYLPHGTDKAEDVLDDAIDEAKRRRRFPDRAPYTFLKNVVLGRVAEALQADALAWTQRFQQFTAPVAAKGVEDAAFYRYNRLAAHAEVGGEPDRFGLSKDDFHRRCRFRAARCPQTLLATATHDHKRGEETRARLLALAERTDRWRDVVEGLAEIGQRYMPGHDTAAQDAAAPPPAKHDPDGQPARAPHPADAYLFYQILAALWPERPERRQEDHEEALVDRLTAYMEKACRESKRETRWIDSDEAYEAGIERFVRGLATDEATAAVLDDFADTLAVDGFFTGLSQLALKCLTPGIPDFYQGRELPDTSLVDPDNRRPVDYARRRAYLNEMEAPLEHPDADTIRHWIQDQDERAKLFFAARLLRFRQAHPRLFADGSYEPLSVNGPDADVWIAFARREGHHALVAALPRFPKRWHASHAATLALPEDLAEGPLIDVLGGGAIEAGSDATLALEAPPLPWVVLTSGS